MESRREQPFRLMDLPAEIRLLIYEFILVERTHIHWQPETDMERHELVDHDESKEEVVDAQGENNEHGKKKRDTGLPTMDGPGTLSFTFHHISFEILRACCTIWNEAKAIMTIKAHDIREMTPRAYEAVQNEYFNRISNTLCTIIDVALRWSHVLEQGQHMTLQDWIAQCDEDLPKDFDRASRIVLLFVDQAGRQMLQRKKKLELPRSVRRNANQHPAAASYFVFQLRDHRNIAQLPDLYSQIKRNTIEMWNRKVSLKVVPIARRNNREREYAIIWINKVEHEHASRIQILDIKIGDYYDHLGLEQ